MRKQILVNHCKWLVMMCHISVIGNLKCYGWCFECFSTINSFPVVIFLQVSFPLIMILVIVCKYWTSCLSFALFATALTSQAWPYCGKMFNLAYVRKRENTAMPVCLSLISETWVPFSSNHKHSMDLHKLRQHADMKAFCRLFGASHFPCFITEKEMTGSSIPQRACLYKNTFSPQIGHFRLGNSRAMLIHVSRTLLSVNGSLSPSLRLIVWFHTFSSGIVHLVTLVSDRAEVANLYRIILVTTPPETSVCFAILD